MTNRRERWKGKNDKSDVPKLFDFRGNNRNIADIGSGPDLKIDILSRLKEERLERSLEQALRQGNKTYRGQRKVRKR